LTTRISHIPEYRVVVPGKAVSFRSPNAGAYKRRVAMLARRVFARPCSQEHVQFLIDYFHADRRRMDVDNIAKAVMDALNAIAYRDDRQVRVVHAQAHYTGDTFVLPEGPADLVKPLAMYPEYLFLRVRAVSD
jgi:Holliday junction resolvase RusA-like endonuclease